MKRYETTTIDNSVPATCERLEKLQERLDFFKENKEVRSVLEQTYCRELERLRINKACEKSLPYLQWYLSYLGWKR